MPILFAPFDARTTGAVAAGIGLEHKVLAAERDLDSVKWFAYRFMSPMSATREFYRTYLENRRRYVWKNVDIGVLPMLRDRPLLTLAPKDLTAVWTARQRADELGLPYEFYISFSMNFWSRRSGEGRNSRAPRWNQLHFTANSKYAWTTEMNKVLLEHLKVVADELASVPELDANSFDNAPGQREARAFVGILWEAGALSANMFVRKWCYDYPVMSLLSMRRIIPRDMLRRVLTSLDDYPQKRASKPAGKVDLRPSCFAMPGAYAPVTPKCSTCIFAAKCESASNEVKGLIYSVAGSEDPRRAQRLKAGRERQRRYEQKKKLGLAGAAILATTP